MFGRIVSHSKMVVVALAVVALVVVGCSSSAGSSASSAIGGASGAGNGNGGNGNGGGAQAGGGAPSDMCSVLTDAQVAAAVGASLGKGVSQNGGVMCLWQDATNGQADISVEDGGATFDGLCTIAGPLKSVDGVGDKACFVEASKLATSLEFVKSGQLYTMHVFLPNGTIQQIEAAEKTLAQQAAAKL